MPDIYIKLSAAEYAILREALVDAAYGDRWIESAEATMKAILERAPSTIEQILAAAKEQP